MNARDIGLIRLAAQRITTKKFDQPDEVVRHMLAMQAQDYAGGLWSIGLRTNGAAKSNVEQAIRDHKIIRTWPMRGTLHFVHADDVHWLLDLLAPRATAVAKNRRVTMLGLTDEIVEEAEKALRSELKGGKSIARNNVVKLLAEKVKGIQIANQHTQHLMRNFGERGVICFGPNEGKQPTFVLLDEWVPKSKKKDRAEALAELARRYFISHGPASLKDFSGWAMLTVSDAKAGLEAVKDELEMFEYDGMAYYHAPGLKPVPQDAALLLPGFDEYLLGYKDRSAVLKIEHAGKIVPGGNGMFLATVVNDGQIVGLWRRKVNAQSVTYAYEYFDDPFPTKDSEEKYTSFVLN